MAPPAKHRRRLVLTLQTGTGASVSGVDIAARSWKISKRRTGSRRLESKTHISELAEDALIAFGGTYIPIVTATPLSRQVEL